MLLDDEGVVKICDFGISRKVGRELLNDYVGTPAFMAPEIHQRKPYKGQNADIWSLGVLLFVMVCGQLPFKVSGKSGD